MARPKTQATDLEQIRDMATRQRMNAEMIARVFGCSAATIRHRMNEIGIGGRKKDKLGISTEDVRRLYIDEGKSLKEIGKLLKCSNGAVRDRVVDGGFLKELPYIQKTGNRKFFMTKEELLDRHIAKNQSDSEIGREFDVSNLTVANRRKKFGIKRTHARNSRLLPLVEIRSMYIDKQMTMNEIANHFGCSETTVRSFIDRRGIGIGREGHISRQSERNKSRYTREFVSGGYSRMKKPDHPSANRDGYVDVHRYNAEVAIGRPIEFGEQVHHINLNKLDNDPVNLSVLPSKAIHAIVHKYMERVAAYLCGLTKIRPEGINFGQDVFWAGKYVTYIDLIENMEVSGLMNKPTKDFEAVIRNGQKAVVN